MATSPAPTEMAAMESESSLSPRTMLQRHAESSPRTLQRWCAYHEQVICYSEADAAAKEEAVADLQRRLQVLQQGALKERMKAQQHRELHAAATSRHRDRAKAADASAAGWQASPAWCIRTRPPCPPGRSVTVHPASCLHSFCPTPPACSVMHSLPLALLHVCRPRCSQGPQRIIH